ncbi:cobyric acid synthase [Bacillus infantis]|jgi:adenosylcobyric acid synthase|uniref:cobyric acid synthase n=1 Tax=Bacillus infantis TaxID=324767 RepID=UPI00215561FA|nr:cobyric acid synthase [Bacillus infantis]MCR6608948.1 cobyric acid synthase [Bacillus infantis]
MKGIMIQGTASDVGKSFIATALCRLLSNEGLRVAPFKSQNMSNNSYATADGREIGRAQGIQAEAARAEATVWMNPILLKPKSDMSSEVVLLGKAVRTYSGRSYRENFYEKGLAVIQESLKKLEADFDVIVAEGAGSPVEINLKDRELVNMKVADLADIPVILAADIDRGGVFASIIGTLELLTPEERLRVKGLIINKFRGDPDLFADGISWLEERTGIPVLGVLPHLENHMIDGEDSLSLEGSFYKKAGGRIDIAVIRLPYISNYSDIEPFLCEEDVSVRWVKDAAEFGEPDAVIIPGTKSTIHDLQFLRSSGLERSIACFAEEGGRIAGICGGYQMLGEQLYDPEGTDSGTIGLKEKGMGLIAADTTFFRDKITVQAKGSYIASAGFGSGSVEGYEIHLGQTAKKGIDAGRSLFLMEDGREEGYSGGKIIGTYLHHVFHNDTFRNRWLESIRKEKGLPQKEPVRIGDMKDERFEKLASEAKQHLQWDKIKEIIGYEKAYENH